MFYFLLNRRNIVNRNGNTQSLTRFNLSRPLIVFTDSKSTQLVAEPLLMAIFCCLCPAADSGLIFCCWDILLVILIQLITENPSDELWVVQLRVSLMLPNRRMTAQPESHSSSHCSLRGLEIICSVHLGLEECLQHVQLITLFSANGFDFKIIFEYQ